MLGSLRNRMPTFWPHPHKAHPSRPLMAGEEADRSALEGGTAEEHATMEFMKLLLALPLLIGGAVLFVQKVLMWRKP